MFFLCKMCTLIKILYNLNCFKFQTEDLLRPTGRRELSYGTFKCHIRLCSGVFHRSFNEQRPKSFSPRFIFLVFLRPQSPPKDYSLLSVQSVFSSRVHCVLFFVENSFFLSADGNTPGPLFYTASYLKSSYFSFLSVRHRPCR